MDEDSLRNWGYYEPDKGHGHGHPLGFQLMPSVAEQDTKPFLSSRDNPVMVPYNSSYRTRVVTEPPITPMDFVRESWINNRDKFFFHMSPGNNQNPYTHPVIPESPGPHQHPMQMVHHHHQQPDPAKETPRLDLEEEPVTTIKKEPGTAKKRASAPKNPKGKKPRKGPGPKENGNGNNNNNSASSVQRAKRNVEVVINGVDMDITGIPIPVCSCTGTPQQCYRWGCGGWQSACCTTTISMYPLPMSTKRRGARIAGRKMSQGAFKKVLEKLASEGFDFGNSPIDLRTYWAKHGTNKFVIIR